MKIRLLVAISLLCPAAPLAQADTIVVGDSIVVRESEARVPTRGLRMKQVESRFGAPKARSAPVGKPPITRWDYDGFSVYFEFDHVVHTVVQAR